MEKMRPKKFALLFVIFKQQPKINNNIFFSKILVTLISTRSEAWPIQISFLHFASSSLSFKKKTFFLIFSNFLKLDFSVDSLAETGVNVVISIFGDFH
jgi:hypothetical protein